MDIEKHTELGTGEVAKSADEIKAARTKFVEALGRFFCNNNPSQKSFNLGSIPYEYEAAVRADERARVLNELELLVKIAAREQRYRCWDSMDFVFNAETARFRALNAPAPDTQRVLAEWGEATETR